MNAELDFAPLLPMEALAALAALSLAAVVLCLWRGAPGWALRALAALALLTALANPSLRQELRDPLPDVAIVVTDASASNAIDGRAAQTQGAEDELRAALDTLAADPDAPLEVRYARVGRNHEPTTKRLELMVCQNTQENLNKNSSTSGNGNQSKRFRC